MKIVFTNMYENNSFLPIPANNFIPEWYKKTDGYMDDIRRPDPDYGTTATIKKCMPVFDAITSGYLIVSAADIYISQVFDEIDQKNVPHLQWASENLITFHDNKQAKLYPVNWGLKYPKFQNQWSIKTPPGYSCLFITPLHRDLPFTILPGIVDTDKYTNPVNFPFILNDVGWEGMIEAGTPIAQVIPFKRDSWTMEIGSKEEKNKNFDVYRKLKSGFFNVYKNNYWSKKSFK